MNNLSIDNFRTLVDSLSKLYYEDTKRGDTLHIWFEAAKAFSKKKQNTAQTQKFGQSLLINNQQFYTDHDWIGVFITLYRGKYIIRENGEFRTADLNQEMIKVAYNLHIAGISPAKIEEYLRKYPYTKIIRFHTQEYIEPKESQRYSAIEA